MKPRHESEHYQHADVDGTRDAVSAGQVLDQCFVLQRDREPKLCNDERNSDDAEKEASTKNEGEIDESRAKGAEHDWRVRAAALAGPHVRHERGHRARSGPWHV